MSGGGAQGEIESRSLTAWSPPEGAGDVIPGNEAQSKYGPLDFSDPDLRARICTCLMYYFMSHSPSWIRYGCCGDGLAVLRK